MKLLDGSQLAGFIKERQVHQVRSLNQDSAAIHPKLAIIVTVDNPVIDVYVRLKQRYGTDIAVEVEIFRIAQAEVPDKVADLNKDATVQGIIIQLPLENPEQTEELVNLIEPTKDVDALGAKAIYDPATPLAILWLLAGYNVTLVGKHVLLIGRGKLVGAPLERMLLASGITPTVADRETEDLASESILADVIITATGSPAVLTPNMIKEHAVVVDAGVASEAGKTVGDVAPEVYDREDLTISPQKGGVGPLTVCALFENVIRAAQVQVSTDSAN